MRLQRPRLWFRRYGKTTMATHLVQHLPGYVHIDGDILDLDQTNVLRLGGERNDYTMWQVRAGLVPGPRPQMLSRAASEAA
jgi:hypothetical protein